MPRSVASYFSLASNQDRDENDHEDEIHEREVQALRNSYLNAIQSSTTPVSPIDTRRLLHSRYTSDADLRYRLSSRTADEQTGLLSAPDGFGSGYRTVSTPGTPRYALRRNDSYAKSFRRHQGRRESFGGRLARALGAQAGLEGSYEAPPATPSFYVDNRAWYDQFTSTDWVHDSIADAFRVKELRSRKDWRGRLYSFFDGTQGWILVAIIGIITAALAYVVNTLEAAIFDYKEGYCGTGWHRNKRVCCSGATQCDDWRPWSELMQSREIDSVWADFAAFIVWVVFLAVAACLVTLQTKTDISAAISLSTLDENLAADHHRSKTDDEGRSRTQSPGRHHDQTSQRPPVAYYPAAGSGVAEVKVILSGFVLHGYLGLKTLICKAIGLILSVASGLSLGKEGPYVHIATCVGNIACRLFSKYSTNDGKRREVLSASAAAGVAVAFGAPIGGVLFSLEEVSYYFPPKTMFRTFFCCIVAALSLKFLDPYGTGKIVLFEVRYLIDWKFFEIIIFALLGVLGGATGAFFIKASRIWAKTFRRIRIIRKYPVVEVLLVALITGIVSFWNRYTKLPVALLLYELAAPCNAFDSGGSGLCPTQERIPDVIWYLCVAFVVKAALTTITFGIKVPAGIYVPSMVVGGLLGRIVGHAVQYYILEFPGLGSFLGCPVGGAPEDCVVPGVFALVAAGATMCGVTRLSVTLAVILFELTGSLEHVLPFSLGVLIAKWTADALEPLSIYDLLTDMNSYPYLDAKVRPVFTTDLGDITPEPDPIRSIDISISPLVPATHLRAKLKYLHMSGEIDGGLPILRNYNLVGLIPAPGLEYALDRLDESEPSAMCLMSPQDGPIPIAVSLVDDHGITPPPVSNLEDAATAAAQSASERGSYASDHDPRDFTPFIDPAPVSLDINSPMDLVFECFVKLGLRYICVLRDGRFAGLVHKKAFVKYVREVEDEQREDGLSALFSCLRR